LFAQPGEQFPSVWLSLLLLVLLVWLREMSQRTNSGPAWP
jgi:hypothetical protein